MNNNRLAEFRLAYRSLLLEAQSLQREGWRKIGEATSTTRYTSFMSFYRPGARGRIRLYVERGRAYRINGKGALSRI